MFPDGMGACATARTGARGPPCRAPTPPPAAGCRRVVVGDEHHARAEGPGPVGALGPVEDPQRRPVVDVDAERLAADDLAERAREVQARRVVEGCEGVLTLRRLHTRVDHDPDDEPDDDHDRDQQIADVPVAGEEPAPGRGRRRSPAALVVGSLRSPFIIATPVPAHAHGHSTAPLRIVNEVRPGATRGQGRSRSAMSARSRRSSSSWWRPMTCMPTGRPSTVPDRDRHGRVAARSWRGR